MPLRLLRIAYAIEFLIAVIAMSVLWSQVGGQSHLDLMPWYLKFVLVMAGSIVCVRLTAAMATGERPWTKRSLLWLAILILILAICAVATYYYHLYEPNEPDETQQVLT